LNQSRDATITTPHKIVCLFDTNPVDSSRGLNDSTTGFLNKPQEDQQYKLKTAFRDLAQKKTHWKKIEAFAFPTYQKGDAHLDLKKVFKLLCQIYVTDNGIAPDNTVTTPELALKFKRKGILSSTIPSTNVQSAQPDQGADADINSLKFSKGFDSLLNKKSELGEIDFSGINEIRKFFEFSSFNTEEKLLINRVAFLIFKRRGAKTAFNDFYRQMKILEEGTSESKIILLFDLLDEDSNGTIIVRDLEKVLNISFLQHTEICDGYEETINAAFQEHKTIDKRTLLKVFLNNVNAKEILEAYLQIKS